MVLIVAKCKCINIPFRFYSLQFIFTSIHIILTGIKEFLLPLHDLILPGDQIQIHGFLFSQSNLIIKYFTLNFIFSIHHFHALVDWPIQANLIISSHSLRLIAFMPQSMKMKDGKYDFMSLVWNSLSAERICLVLSLSRGNFSWNHLFLN